MTDETTEFSLADLCDLDVSEIEEIRFEQRAAGIYDFKCVSSNLEEGKNSDDEKQFYWEGKFEVVEMISSLESGVKPEDEKGKVHQERKTIDPTDPETGIGRIRAFVTDLGFDSRGKLGPVVKQIEGHIFRAKIVKRPNKKDPSITYANLQLDPPKKAAA